MEENEKLFESKIEEYLISTTGGWSKATDQGFRNADAIDIDTLCTFVENTQQLAWTQFVKRCTVIDFLVYMVFIPHTIRHRKSG